ncbi:hypothetical protein B0A55_12155 [Friedmanniomyces simplex]|uniref:Metallo-beta-lactamase domain-containing protein n=1 Tax=Friedmanniomyces simplex TaxID=329884 RepID=A0A4U0WEY7_9PEZI|nr:hypothetical protein B0A55_12155 [Friedmanniomyces simplex]
MEPTIHTVFESVTGTWQYIVADPRTKETAIIDTVLDYNKDMGVISTASADKLLDVVTDNDYTVSYILETHAHADHLTASRYLQKMLSQRQNERRPLICIGEHIAQVQETLGQIYDISESELYGAFDYTFSDGETFRLGNIQAQVVHLPGHTPDHIGYIIGSNIFTGDSIFNPDVGSARCDFPGGSATALYNSAGRLLSFPSHFRLYTGHDYPPKDRGVRGPEQSGAIPYTTVEQQSKENKHVKSGTQEDEFVKMRSERDSTLSEPKLLRPSMHVNLRGGRLPACSTKGFKLEQIPASIVGAE